MARSMLVGIDLGKELGAFVFESIANGGIRG